MEPAKSVSQTTRLPCQQAGSSLKTERSRGRMSSREAGKGSGEQAKQWPHRCEESQCYREGGEEGSSGSELGGGVYWIR